MDKFGDMDLFVKVIKNGGLAAAGREAGLSPARMTARINGMEAHYGVRLLNRTTRQVTLTEEGRLFYEACLRVLAEVNEAENRLQVGREALSGPLRVTAPSDIGQQHIAPVLDSFVKNHPDVRPYLYLADGVVNLTEQGIDVAVRYGALSDSSLVARRLVKSHRVLCASPGYLKRKGTPKAPADLQQHDCLAMIRIGEPLVSWYFRKGDQSFNAMINPSRSTNDGALIRRWAIQGAGIALKSYCDVASDIKAKRLRVVLSDYVQDFQGKGSDFSADLHVIYPGRTYQPERVRVFVDMLLEHFGKL